MYTVKKFIKINWYYWMFYSRTLKLQQLANYSKDIEKDGFVCDDNGLNSVMKMKHAMLCQKAFWIQCWISNLYIYFL